jgi:hypothetical protein
MRFWAVAVTLWQTIICASGVACIGMGLFKKEFKPLGWTTALVWGNDKNARIPRWIAGPFYVVLGAVMVYLSLTRKL